MHGKCECHRYIDTQCDYCFEVSVKNSDPYKSLKDDLYKIKRLVRRAKREISSYGKIQDETLTELMRAAR